MRTFQIVLVLAIQAPWLACVLFPEWVMHHLRNLSEDN